jgi:MFS family permease
MASKLGGIGDAFADRNFRIYSVGSILSWLSFFIQMVAISWTTWELTHSTTWLAIIAVLDIAPNLVFLPLGGALADRIDRFRMMLIAYGAAWLHVVALTAFSYAGHLSIGVLAGLSFLHGLIHSFSVPANYGIMPRFIARERLSSAIAVNAAMTQFAIFAGPALGGWIIAHHGVTAAFAANVVGYLIYFASVAMLRAPADFTPPPASGRSILADMADGARYILAHRGISALLALMLFGDALSTSVYQLLPAISANLLGARVGGMSSLLSAAGLGATLSALWLAHGGTRLATIRTVLIAYLAFAVTVAALMFAADLLVAIAIMVAFGCAGEIRRTGAVSLLQTTVSDAQRGRVMGTQFMVQRIAGGMGVMMVGAFSSASGIRPPMLFMVVAALCLWLIAFVNRNRLAASFTSKD